MCPCNRPHYYILRIKPSLILRFLKLIMALNSLFCADVPLSNYSLTNFVCGLMGDKLLDTQINARRIKFVNSKTCINIIIIMLFYTNCTCSLAKANLGYLNGTKISSIGGPRPPPLNTPMCITNLFLKLSIGNAIFLTYTMSQKLHMEILQYLLSNHNRFAKVFTITNK